MEALRKKNIFLKTGAGVRETRDKITKVLGLDYKNYFAERNG
jgi:hypothetical protein